MSTLTYDQLGLSPDALKALDALPDTPYRTGLAALARFAVAHTT